MGARRASPFDQLLGRPAVPDGVWPHWWRVNCGRIVASETGPIRSPEQISSSKSKAKREHDETVQPQMQKLSPATPATLEVGKPLLPVSLDQAQKPKRPAKQWEQLSLGLSEKDVLLRDIERAQRSAWSMVVAKGLGRTHSKRRTKLIAPIHCTTTKQGQEP